MDRKDRFLEDYAEGEIVEFGSTAVTAAQIVAFAEAFDPQPFHLSDEAGAKTPYGGLIASGWHTAGMTMRMMVEHIISRHGLGSPGVDELRWLRPVRPGDVLTCRASILSVRRSRSKPDRGVVRQQIETLNQHGEVVLSWIGNAMVRARHLPG
ncbi:MAG: MaoC family dehydratase [Acetobacteraceae bacterium]|nr:MaoC family dehydratase [Acetobacteraceae bacterium]